MYCIYFVCVLFFSSVAVCAAPPNLIRCGFIIDVVDIETTNRIDDNILLLPKTFIGMYLIEYSYAQWVLEEKIGLRNEYLPTSRNLYFIIALCGTGWMVAECLSGEILLLLLISTCSSSSYSYRHIG